MSEKTNEKTATSPRAESELAARIFIELVARNVTITDGAVKMSTGADNLAKLSFKLAEVFLAVDLAARASEMPKNPTYKLGNEDIALWMK